MEANGHAVFYDEKKLLFAYATTSIDASNFRKVCLESVDDSFRVIGMRCYNVHVSVLRTRSSLVETFWPVLDRCSSSRRSRQR